MKNKFFTAKLFLVFILLGISTPLFADSVTFDLTSAQAGQSLGVTLPTSVNTGSNIADNAMTISDFTLSLSKGNGNVQPQFCAETTDKVYYVNLKNKNTLTVTTDDRYVIYAAILNGSGMSQNISSSEGSFSASSKTTRWTGCSHSLTFTSKDSGVKITSVEIIYGKASCIRSQDYDLTQINGTGTDEVVWKMDLCQLVGKKAEGSNSPKNYSGAYFYKNNTFELIPEDGIIIRSIEFTTNSVTNLYNGGQAFSSTNSYSVPNNDAKIVAVCPTDGTQPVSCSLGYGGVIITNLQILYESSYYSRTVSSVGNYGTICLPFAVKPTDRTGATFYKVEGQTSEGIVLEEETGSLVAGQPYIFKATANTLTATYSGNAVSSPVTTTGLVGNLFSTKVSVPQGCYVLSNNTIRKLDGGSATVGQYRAYLNLDGVPTYSAEQVKGMTSLSFEETDGILTPQKTDASTIYDLSGRRVTNPSHGIYLLNGKKVLR